MKSRPPGSLWEWDELRLIEAEAGLHLRGTDVGAEDLAKASRVWNRVPKLKLIEVTAGEDWFAVSPAPGQPFSQLALASLLRTVRYLGWRVSNLRRRLSPALALHVARIYGAHTLAWRNSWIKVIAPAVMAVERRLQRHPASVDNMVAALADQPPVMDLTAFDRLSVESVSRALPADERANYFKAMR